MFPPDVPDCLRGLLRGELRKVFVREEFRRSGLFYRSPPLRCYARRSITRFGEVDICRAVVLYEPRITPSVLQRNSDYNGRSAGFLASGYEYLASLEYELTGTEDGKFSDDDDSVGTGATTPTIGSGFEENVQDMQAFGERLAWTDMVHPATRIAVLGAQQSTPQLEISSITDFLTDGEPERDNLQIDPSILALVSLSPNKNMPLDLFEDQASAAPFALTLSDVGLDTWADELTATFGSTETAPQLPELVFDDPVDD